MYTELQKLQFLTHQFNLLFEKAENTILRFGADEPFYKAMNANSPAIIYSREQYLSSALHEIAHWCIAGEQRRKLDDYGYWYEPEGRSQNQQTLFEQVEVKPQAIEWIFSQICGHVFHLSADNLESGIQASASFQKKVEQQMNDYRYLDRLPKRAQLLAYQLVQTFNLDDTDNKKQELIFSHV